MFIIYIHIYMQTWIEAYLFTIWERERVWNILQDVYLLLIRCLFKVWESDSDYLKASQVPVCYWTGNKGGAETKYFIYPLDAFFTYNWRHKRNHMLRGSVYVATWPDYTCRCCTLHHVNTFRTALCTPLCPGHLWEVHGFYLMSSLYNQEQLPDLPGDTLRDWQGPPLN
jgi:hypothetical protein